MNRTPTDLNTELEAQLRLEMLLTNLGEVCWRYLWIDRETVSARRQIVQALDPDRRVPGQLEGESAFE